MQSESIHRRVQYSHWHRIYSVTIFWKCQFSSFHKTLTHSITLTKRHWQKSFLIPISTWHDMTQQVTKCSRGRAVTRIKAVTWLLILSRNYMSNPFCSRKAVRALSLRKQMLQRVVIQQCVLPEPTAVMLHWQTALQQWVLPFNLSGLHHLKGDTAFCTSRTVHNPRHKEAMSIPEPGNLEMAPSVPSMCLPNPILSFQEQPQMDAQWQAAQAKRFLDYILPDFRYF